MPLPFPRVTALFSQQSHQPSIVLQDCGQFTYTFRFRLASLNCGSSVITKRPSPSRCLLPSKSVHPSTTPPRWTTSVQYRRKTGRFYVTSSRAGTEGVKQVTKRAKLIYEGKRRGVLRATGAERQLERRGQRTSDEDSETDPPSPLQVERISPICCIEPSSRCPSSQFCHQSSERRKPPAITSFHTTQRRPDRTEARCRTTRSELSTSRSSKMSSSRRASTSRRVVLMNMSLRS